MTSESRRWIEGSIFLLLFCLTIPSANYMVQHFGTVCRPDGPCLIPVAPGLMAPSGVLMVGAALVLRDLVQRRLGIGVAVAGILIGAGMSGLVAPMALVMASATAYMVSEFADLAIYTPLARRWFVTAVVASSLVGLVIDSALFVWFAFGTFEFLPGQVMGKVWMVIAAIPIVAWLRRRDERMGLLPA